MKIYPELILGETKAVARCHTLWTNRPGLSRYEIGPFMQKSDAVEEARGVLSKVMAMDVS